jgi:hypothetical protein
MGFQYNGKLRCAEIIIFNGSTNGMHYIRRKETIDDYLATIVCLESCYPRLC